MRVVDLAGWLDVTFMALSVMRYVAFPATRPRWSHLAALLTAGTCAIVVL